MASIENDVFDIIAQQAHIDRAKITRDANLADLDIQSLDVVEIIFAIEEKFDISIPYNANDPTGGGTGIPFKTIGEVVDAISKLISERDAAKTA